MAKKNETIIEENKPEATKVAEPPQENSKTKCCKKGKFSLCKLSLIATLLVVAAIFTMPYWKPFVSPEITTKIDNVKNSLFAKNTQSSDANTALDFIDKQTDETSTEAVEVAVQDAQEADQDEIIKSLNARIEQLESKLSSENNSPLASVDSESIKLALFKTEELKNNIAKLNKEYEDLKNDLSKQGSETNSRILSLMDRNDNLKKELESQTSLSSETDKKITQEISMISGAKADASTVLSMVGKLSSLESKIEYLASQRGEAVIMLLAASQLKQAIDKGEIYEIELKTLSSLGAGEEFIEKTVKTLEPYAMNGVKTETSIKIDFEKAVYNAVWNAKKYNDNEFLHRLHDKLTSMVKVRRTDFKKEAKPSLEGQIALAEKYLKVDELENALEAIKKIENPKAIEKLAPWIEETSAKVSVNKAVSELTSYALAEVKAKNIKGSN